MALRNRAVATVAQWTSLVPQYLERLQWVTVIGKSIPAWPAMAWVIFFMVTPLGLMLVFSFWRYSQFNLYPDFTLTNYKAFFNSSII